MAHYFYLTTMEREEPVSIMLRFRENGCQFKVSTKIKVRAKDWNVDKQRVRETDELSQYKNARLAAFQREAERASLRMADEKWSFDEARDSLLREMGIIKSAKDAPGNTLLDYYHEWATTKREGRTPTKQNLLSWNIIREFRPTISFKEVDGFFFQDFCRWMDEVKRYKANTKALQIKTLKAVMNAAFREGKHANLAYRDFRIPTEEVDNVYLTQDELDALYDLPLTGYKAKARDIFLVGCYTAMRWSDFSRLQEKDITDDTIYFTHHKTGFRVSIPLHPIVKEVLERYGGRVPSISEQKLNAYIKEVCREAGITQPVTKVYTKGGQRIEEVRQKCDMVTTHTARRTAATNMYKSGLPAYNIMLITGHTSEATFRKYIKFEKERNAEMMRDNPYFRKRSEDSPSGR